jgi:tRNA (cytidine/uridine-2'-O-)-methyltransferase
MRPALALYQPDIPQNTGTLLRMGACLGVDVHIIEPAGFPVTDRALRRAGLDYLDHVQIMRHPTVEAFLTVMETTGRRVVAIETGVGIAHTDFAFALTDILLLGRESAGLPEAVTARCAAHVTIPMRGGFRSLNLAVAGAIAMGEALRQTAEFSGR